MADSIDRLPAAALGVIVRKLEDARDVARLACVSKRWNQLVWQVPSLVFPPGTTLSTASAMILRMEKLSKLVLRLDPRSLLEAAQSQPNSEPPVAAAARPAAAKAFGSERIDPEACFASLKAALVKWTPALKSLHYFALSLKSHKKLLSDKDFECKLTFQMPLLETLQLEYFPFSVHLGDCYNPHLHSLSIGAPGAWSCEPWSLNPLKFDSECARLKSVSFYGLYYNIHHDMVGRVLKNCPALETFFLRAGPCVFGLNLWPVFYSLEHESLKHLTMYFRGNINHVSLRLPNLETLEVQAVKRLKVLDSPLLQKLHLRLMFDDAEVSFSPVPCDLGELTLEQQYEEDGVPLHKILVKDDRDEEESDEEEPDEEDESDWDEASDEEGGEESDANNPSGQGKDKNVEKESGSGRNLDGGDLDVGQLLLLELVSANKHSLKVLKWFGMMTSPSAFAEITPLLVKLKEMWFIPEATAGVSTFTPFAAPNLEALVLPGKHLPPNCYHARLETPKQRESVEWLAPVLQRYMSCCPSLKTIQFGSREYFDQEDIEALERLSSATGQGVQVVHSLLLYKYPPPASK